MTLIAAPLFAQGPPPIQDNSFLIEEAYNQERGIVQHISFFSREWKSRNWAYSFTQEWPVRGQRSQFSYSVLLLRQAETNHPSTGLGDLLLNYRFQALGDREHRIWMAPRLSLSVPTGRSSKGMGSGSFGFELALPVSMELAPKLVTHLNAGITLHPAARNEAGVLATTMGWKAGASAIYLVGPSFNLMVESIVVNEAEIVGPKQIQRSTAWFVSPGIRWAHNFTSGLQVVPGAAYMVDLSKGPGQSGLLLYLSFEHPFKRLSRDDRF